MLQCAVQSRTSKGITDPLLLIIFDSKPVNAPPNIHQKVVPTKSGPTLYMHHVEQNNLSSLMVSGPFNSPNLRYNSKADVYYFDSCQTLEKLRPPKAAPQQQPSPFNALRVLSPEAGTGTAGHLHLLSPEAGTGTAGHLHLLRPEAGTGP
ncbi:hypothetical protein niasHT_002073 [Heterodera trifolii]|uniref:Uncharacterized protein n=1 Tax=Heterodera trifolii TaxID=157864 RepID=A0ABD2LVK3_9BILA